MPKHNVKLTSELATLRQLEHECKNERKLAALRTVIDTGVASGVAKPGVFGRIRRKHGLPNSKTIIPRTRSGRSTSCS